MSRWACLTPAFEDLAGVSRPGNWGHPSRLTPVWGPKLGRQAGRLHLCKLDSHRYVRNLAKLDLPQMDGTLNRARPSSPSTCHSVVN
jgi:hypothetical protein